MKTEALALANKRNSNFNCNDNEGHFSTGSPGYSDLSSAGTPGPYWNDRIGSFVCHPR
jgi:hypothetical protein